MNKKKTTDTPIIKQYLEIKNNYKDMILLYRVGDFYEFYYDDAIKVSEILNITLTKRNYSNSPPIPMAGFPCHVLDNYLIKLIKHGESLAICEQLNGDVDYKNKEGIIKRKVVRIITPGTICEDTLLNTNRENIIGSIYESDYTNRFGYATLDITSGNFVGYEIKDKFSLKIKLKLTNPVELLYPKNFKNKDLLKNHFSLKERPEWEFDPLFAKEEIKKQFNIFDVDCFDLHYAKLAIRAAGSLLNYAKLNYNMKHIPHISFLKIKHPEDTIMIDSITVKNLKLIEDIIPNNISLFKVLDNNCTPMGSRLLRRWILNPIRDMFELESRHKSILYLRKYYKKIKSELKNIGDLERIFSRLGLREIKPRDLLVILKSIKTLPKIKSVLQKSKIPHLLLLNNNIEDFSLLEKLLTKSINTEPPSKVDEGGVIAKGYNPILDHLRSLAINQDEGVSILEKKEREITGINSLKIIYQQKNGYFIQIKKTLSSKVKLPRNYQRIQSLSRVERYVTLELKEYEKRISFYNMKAICFEKILYYEIINNLFLLLNSLLKMSKAISEIDLLTNLAERSLTLKYICPKFSNRKIFKYSGGRHPLVEHIKNDFVKNDFNLNSYNNTYLITGPNMGGKSTYMKQTALIAVMSYIGSFVPADSALIGPIDSIFTRMGVNDDISTGRSSFMVEMIETANILNNATKNSLVLIDEIGRGTNNLEGISIAWGCIRHLVKTNSLNLIATHYIELTNISSTIKRVKNIHFTISKKGKDVIFLHKLKDGAQSKNCGIIVAQMAGLPKNVIKYAYSKFNKLKKKENKIF